MADVGYIALVVAGFSAYWWRHLRPARSRALAPGLFAADAEVAIHVAVHEASSRKQPISSIHLLYGLLQDETVIAAITTAGDNPDALEDRVLAALAAPGRLPQDAHVVVSQVAAVVHRAERQASCTDLWAFLGGTAAGALLDEAKLDRGAVLFALFHGGRAPDITLADDRDVFVVLRNDHYTTQVFVCSALRSVFELTEEQAAAIMHAAHTTGRAVIGRFSAAAARTKIAEIRARARAHAFPLWVGVEPT